MLTEKRSLVNCLLDDQVRTVSHGCFLLLKHWDHLSIYYPNPNPNLFRKLSYFQGTTFCILAETKLSIHNTFESTCLAVAGTLSR